MIRRVAVVLASVAGLATAAHAWRERAPAEPAAAKVRWSTGHWYSYFLRDPAQIRWSAYTHVVHVVKVPRPDGSLANDGWSDPTALIALAHARGVKVLLGVGGANAGVLGAPALPSTWPSGPAHEAMVAATVALMAEHHYDGIDVDREDDAPESAYVATHRAFRRALEAHPGKVLTCATAPFLLSRFTARAGAPCDQINLMTYKHPASEIAAVLAQYTRRSFPRSKLGVGFGMGDPNDGGCGGSRGAELDTTASACAAKAALAVRAGAAGFQSWGMGACASYPACEMAWERFVPAH